MSSILAGSEHDIFISYRQKDNKYDGWVTEFVSDLKLELGPARQRKLFAPFLFSCIVIAVGS